MKPRRRYPADDRLNARQEFALLWLAAEEGKPYPYAWRLADALKTAGLQTGRRRYTDTANGPARAAGRTLSALAARGLADSSTPGGEAFQAVQWRITDAGRELAAKWAT